MSASNPLLLTQSISPVPSSTHNDSPSYHHASADREEAGYAPFPPASEEKLPTAQWSQQTTDGTVQPSPTIENGAVLDGQVETETKQTRCVGIWAPWKRRDGWSGWMGESVASKALVWSLITHAFATGILDATTYLDFNTFASNQTGNTILLTNALVRLSKPTLLLTGVSFGAFISSALLFGQLGHLFGVRRRAWLLLNVFYQIICLILAVIFLSPAGPSPTRLGGKHDWAVILLFASMSGAQVAAARQASVQEIPTAPMTSTYVDLVSDQHLFAGFRQREGSPRNRRLGYVMAMIVGSFIGGVMHKYAGSWAVVLIAMVFKLAVIVMISLAPAEEIKVKQ